ncbi:MAG: hypothetical protein ACD_28C00365G0003 [uncultured bacterium]|nr:MAG: hypothetical protein ACD_28C00365G0003 [uncultured bacterium]
MSSNAHGNNERKSLDDFRLVLDAVVQAYQAAVISSSGIQEDGVDSIVEAAPITRRSWNEVIQQAADMFTLYPRNEAEILLKEVLTSRGIDSFWQNQLVVQVLTEIKKRSRQASEATDEAIKNLPSENAIREQVSRAQEAHRQFLEKMERDTPSVPGVNRYLPTL